MTHIIDKKSVGIAYHYVAPSMTRQAWQTTNIGCQIAIILRRQTYICSKNKKYIFSFGT